MPYKFEHIPINNPEQDKRVKLTDEDKANIIAEYASGTISQRGLAKKYNVSRRLIQFILAPEKLLENRQQFLDRQKDGRYYDKEKHNEYMRNHRQHKKELWEKGLLGNEGKS